MRKMLLFIRKNFYANKLKFVGLTTLTLVVAVVAGVLLDTFLAFTLLFNFLRTLVVIPLAASVFALGYCAALANEDAQRKTNPEWVPLKARWSPGWRQRFAIVIAAVLFVMSYSSAHTRVYTLVTSLIFASALGLIFFVMKTRDERFNEENGIPDERDIDINRKLALAEEKRMEARRAKDEEKKRRKEEKEERAERLKSIF